MATVVGTSTPLEYTLCLSCNEIHRILSVLHNTPQYYTTNGTNEKNKGYNYDLEDELSNKVVVSRLETHSTGFVNTKQDGLLRSEWTSNMGSKNGGSGGIRLDKIAFDYPSETLTHITGYYGSTILRGPTVVKSLTFYTNKKKYGPFGDEHGISFSSGSNNGVIVGFHGRKGWFIDSIGVHVLEGTLSISRPPIPRPTYVSIDTNEVQVIPGAAKEAAPPVSRPWVGGGGKPWDDEVFSGV
ncbi:hypothetical protein H0E87_003907 [Populus deltoides]|uniref:Jacalin-type lectin domain-containing protein n=1 Tax=Populus deltoides TaxID=3696 RepID=A0A8T2ZCX9_POPDE|nr:hypothetical protein H0E87_003907 [Populus deltoides]